jgi:two-component system response regulator ChvI
MQTINRHHHFIACKGYDMAIMKKIQSISQGIPHLIQNQDTTTRRIMLVEDNEDINLLFWTVLQDADNRLNIDAFTDPFVALENFRPGLYDLLLIDIAMPKMDGFELYSRIRKIDDSVKTCFLTAGEMYYKELREEAFPDLDVDCLIGKPIANEDLVRRVKELLDLS